MYEYIISGLGYTRITSNSSLENKNLISAVNAALKDVNNDPLFKIGGLFNAFTEYRIGEEIKNHFDGFHSVHADSGGLQMVTLGKEVTPEIQETIYTRQAEMSDIAMCFDDIPLQVDVNSSSTSNRTSISNKTFDKTKIKAHAESTGRNINNQLKKFRDKRSESKVMLIVQGNDRYDMAKWAEYAYAVVDDDLKDGIYGLALADTCMGNGILETVEMCASVCLMNIPDRIKKNLHFLGVGSVSRLLPIIELTKSGYFKDCHISFDSTTHSSAYIMGKYYNSEGKSLDLGNKSTPAHEKYFSDIYELMVKYYNTNITKEEYVDHMCKHLTYPQLRQSTDDTNKKLFFLNMTMFFTTLINAIRFKTVIMNCYNNSDIYYDVIFHTKNVKSLTSLSNVTDKQSFDTWFENYSQYVKSARIKTTAQIPITLEL